MNIEKILNNFGYVITLADYENFTFKIKITDERKFEMCKDVNFDLSLYNFNLTDEFSIKVGEVGFDRAGYLYVELNLLTGECWDVLEYRNENL